MITTITAPTIAPYFSLARALWIPAVYVEDAETGDWDLHDPDFKEGLSLGAEETESRSDL
jgi:hypothetical protein